MALALFNKPKELPTTRTVSAGLINLIVPPPNKVLDTASLLAHSNQAFIGNDVDRKKFEHLMVSSLLTVAPFGKVCEKTVAMTQMAGNALSAYLTELGTMPSEKNIVVIFPHIFNSHAWASAPPGMPLIQFSHANSSRCDELRFITSTHELVHAISPSIAVTTSSISPKGRSRILRSGAEFLCITPESHPRVRIKFRLLEEIIAESVTRAVGIRNGITYTPVVYARWVLVSNIRAFKHIHEALQLSPVQKVPYREKLMDFRYARSVRDVYQVLRDSFKTSVRLPLPTYTANKQPISYPALSTVIDKINSKLFPEDHSLDSLNKYLFSTLWPTKLKEFLLDMRQHFGQDTIRFIAHVHPCMELELLLFFCPEHFGITDEPTIAKIRHILADGVTTTYQKNGGFLVF